MASANNHLGKKSNNFCWCLYLTFWIDIVTYIIEQLSALGNKVELLNTKNNEGNTPLHWAALNGNLEVVEILVKNGGDCKVKISIIITRSRIFIIVF
jgi:hypothetical protein